MIKDGNKMIPEYIRELQPYEPPLIREGEYRLFMNENLLGPSPKCCEAIRNISEMDFCQYAHNGDYRLAEEIAKIDGISAGNICLNHGSSEIIKQIFSVILCEGDSVLIPTPGWSYYNDAISLVGGNVKYYLLKKEDKFAYDVEELIYAIEKEKPKAVVITSPNMPTGNKIVQEKLVELLEKYNKCHFVIDEAYWGFDKDNTLDIKSLINRYENIIVTRTFSKFFGLASERIGWLITNEKLNIELKKAAPLFGISYTSQVVAIAALESKEYYDQVRKIVSDEVNNFKTKLGELEGFYVYPSSSNFILVKVPQNNNKKIVDYLEDKGFLIRDCSKYGLDSYIRISIGTPSID